MQNNNLYTRSTSNNGMNLCQPRSLMVRKNPKLSTQKGMGITSDWQHGLICAYRFCNWFPDTQMVLWVENNNCNRSVRVKMIDENFQGESKVENRLSIEKGGIEKMIKGFKEERNWTVKKENKLQTDGMYPCRTEYTSNSLVSRN